MNVLSLFDGMSCGRIALKKLGVNVDNYYSSEVDKFAIKVADTNHPEDTINRLGDVRFVDATKLPQIDLLIGGSPCTSFSFAGKRNGMSTVDDIEIHTLEHYLELKEQGFEFDGQSYLFWEYMRLIHETKPKYFLLENVKMTKHWQDILSKAIGVEPIEIISSKFVPQARRRLYWTNIPNIQQPEQRVYDINDYIDGEGFATACGTDRIFKKKQVFNTLTATYYKGIRGSGRPAVSIREGFLDDDREAHRMLSPHECERLQGVPDGYTDVASKSQAYKMLGNGWTVDVVEHIFRNMEL